MYGETKAEKKIREELGYENDTRPWAQFFDYAEMDSEQTEKDGRPRYVSTIYIEKIPTAPDLVVRDKFHRKMIEADKEEFPEAWEIYTRRAAALNEMAPPVRAIPGLDVALFSELRDLDINTCEDLVNYTEDLGEELELMRGMAAQIMEIGENAKSKRQDIRERRAALQRSLERPQDSASARPGPSQPAGGPRPLTLVGGNASPKKVDSFEYTFEV